MSYSKPFAKSEYDARVTKVKQRMQSAGFDLLICQDPASMGWLTGFDGWSFYTPQAVTHLAEVIIEGGDEALAMAKPGVTCEEVEAVWQRVLKRHGYSKESRVGYSIGLNYPPDWGERTASLRPGDTTELQAGMCFHFQSGMWLDGFGAAVSEPFVVTERGGERLSHVARQLIVIE